MRAWLGGRLHYIIHGRRKNEEGGGSGERWFKWGYERGAVEKEERGFH